MTDITETPITSSPEDISLDDFAADLFSKPRAETAEKAPVTETPEETETSHEETTIVETDEDELEAEAEEIEADGGVEPEPKTEKKKSRFQERIDDLTAKLREGDRQKEELAAKLERAIAALETKAPTADETQNAPKTEVRGLVEPTADDLLEDGSPKYPLGDFDPKLLRDLTRYDRAVERAHEAEVAAATKAEQEQIAEFKEVEAKWNDKVQTARTQYPDYVEKGQALLDSLDDIPQDYAVYLTQNLMSMDYGPDVFYYLAEHPEEARAIVNSSPEKALRTLGRIEARFEIAADERSGKETKLRTTSAPEPAPRNKGSNAQAPAPDLTTVGLDDFAKDFLTKPRR